MKKLSLLLLLIIGLIILSCSSDDDNGANGQAPEESTQLLRKMTINGNGDNYSLTFFYNSENKIDRIESAGTGDDFIKQFYYNNGILDRAEFQNLDGVPNGGVEQYIYNNGQLIERQDLFNNDLDETFVYLFNSNLIENIQYIGNGETSFSIQDNFTYDSNNNTISRTMDYVSTFINDEEFTFTYDNKKNPFINFEPNIVLIDDFDSFVNNPTSETLTDLSNDTVIYVKNYTYTYDSNDYATSRTDGTETITYEYY